jgi:hypothetical protein
MKTRIIILYLLFANVCLSFSQVTIGNIEKQNNTTQLKPETYDSLKNFSYHYNEIDYNQYIGLQFYLPPFKNPIASEIKTDRPFLFTPSPNIINVKNPIVYDYVARKENYSPTHKRISYNKIYSYVYEPFHYGTDKKHYLNEEIDPNGYYYGTFDNSMDDYHDFHISNDQIVSNSYFTLIDVLLKESWEKTYRLMKDDVKTKEKEFYKKRKNSPAESDFWENSIDKIVVSHEILQQHSQHKQIFMFRNDKSRDTVYCDGFAIKRFILVPYFLKQKQIYDGKTFFCYTGANSNAPYKIDVSSGVEIKIPLLSKWTCSVDLLDIDYNGKTLRDNKYKIWCVLKNDKGQTVLEDPEKFKNFMEQDAYLKQESENKMKQQQLAAKHKQEEKDRIEKDRKEKELFKLECIKKYGTAMGELIAQGKVKIGMTKDMCKIAWGTPLWTDKLTTEYGESEVWYYGFGYSLNFEDNKLIIIDE